MSIYFPKHAFVYPFIAKREMCANALASTSRIKANSAVHTIVTMTTQTEKINKPTKKIITQKHLCSTGKKKCCLATARSFKIEMNQTEINLQSNLFARLGVFISIVFNEFRCVITILNFCGIFWIICESEKRSLLRYFPKESADSFSCQRFELISF